MNKKNYSQSTILDHYIDKRKIKDKFFNQINSIINWSSISNILEKYYTKGTSATGRKAYPPILLFKMTLLQTWYGLSDYEIESQTNDRLSFMKFCELRLEDDVPDHSAICRFRKVLTEGNVLEELLTQINIQLENHSILVKKGAIIDASITPTQRKPKGKKQIELTKDDPPKLKESIQKGVDKEASWTKKGGKLYYGYKKHYLCDEDTSLVLSVVTSSAKDHDSKFLNTCLEKVDIEKNNGLYADKGYYGSKNEEILKSKGLKSRIQNKALTNKPLSKMSKFRNKLISKTRYKVERIFGGIRRWFKSGLCRYVGQTKTHYQHLLEAISYNLKISPGILISKNIL